MNNRRLACFVGLLAMISACSGTYDVGLGNGGAAGVANVGGAGSTTSAGAPSDAGAGDTPSVGGSPTVGYCGVALPSETSEDFAPPAVVAERVQQFLLGSSVPESTLPATTTRAWASSYALSVLDAVSSPSAPGLRRFIDAWWPGNQDTDLWASYFSSRHGSFGDLLQSEESVEHGAGVLTDPVVLEKETISRRGKYVSESLFCASVPPPPANEPPLEAPGPGQTRRDRLEQQVAPPACSACHRLMDGTGFALATFASDGAFATTEGGLPIRTSSVIQVPNAQILSSTDIRDFGAQASSNCVALSCFARRLLEDARQSAALPGAAASDSDVASLASAIHAADGDLRQAVKALVESDAFLRPE